MQTRSYWDEDLALLSAENVSISLETAGLGSRLAAVSLDTLFQVLIWSGVMLGWAGLESYLQLSAVIGELGMSILVGLFYVFTFLVFFGYFFFFEWLWEGQTPGKRQFGLRVTMSDGRPLNMWSALARNLVRLADFMLPPPYGLGALVALSSSLNQRAGDLVAGTIVVREGRRENRRQPLSMREAIRNFLEQQTTLPGEQEVTAYRDIDLKAEASDVFEAAPVDLGAHALARALSREEYELARDFLARRAKMPLAARARLATALSNRLRGRLEGVELEDVPTENEAFLEWIVVKARGMF